MTAEAIDRSTGAAALAAHLAGDAAATRAILDAAGPAILGDSLALQLRAIAAADPADARALFAMAALDSPSPDAGAFFNMAVCEQEAGHESRALSHYLAALRLDPAHLGALNNASDILRRECREDEAWAAIQAYLGAGGNPDGIELRIAKIADAVGEVDAARHWFARALAREPSPTTRWEHAMQALRDEEFGTGWAGYEMRRVLYDHAILGLVAHTAPEWSGSAVTGGSLLVHKEQGLGDTIMFASCLADVSAQAGPPVLAVQPPLARLFAMNFPECEVWASSSTPQAPGPEHQAWLPLARPIAAQVPFCSLALHTRSKGFPPPTAYLRADPAEVAVWEQRLRALAPSRAGQLRAGLVIAARRDGAVGTGVADGAAKTIPPRIAQALAVEGVAWFGLHDRATAGDLVAIPGLDAVDTSDWLFDLADTAALIDRLGVVVAVDTAVAHLAGAMGRKVLLMLRHNADWRWGRERRDSYWYPDVEVFRQSVEGDWPSVLGPVRDRLREIAGERT